MLSDEAKLACRVLAGLPPHKREYAHLVEALASRLQHQSEEGSRRARAVRALMDCMADGVIQKVNGKLMTLDQLEKEMGGEF